MRVLVVEDNAAFATQVAAFVRAQGWEVEVQPDGLEAAWRLMALPPVDVVLLDLVVPGMDGWDFLARAQSVPALRDLPILVLTQMPTLEGWQRTMLGARGRLQKPTGPASAPLFWEELGEALHRVQAALQGPGV